MVTGNIFKGLVFDGVDSTQYGVYITGEAVYNAPTRDVEMIEIPGRNGAYALDKGRFNNIEVTYPAGIFGKDESEFAQAISDFRNALASRVGYKRLADDYNSGEYRMAVYLSGLEVSPSQLKAGQFNITFNCKPQRFLTSGETQSTVTSGRTITNPTLFESHPLLLVDGYGNFNINGEQMAIQQGSVIGETALDMARATSVSYLGSNTLRGEITLTASNLSDDTALSGDTITLGVQSFSFRAKTANVGISSFEANSETGNYARSTNARVSGSYYATFNASTLQNEFSYGTSATHTETVTTHYEMTLVGGTQYTSAASFSFSIAYDGANKFTVRCDFSIPMGKGLLVDTSYTNIVTGSGVSYVDSTKSALGQLYIDLDIGECYRIENGQYISINTATTLPADLPTLKPGDNVITYDNTFTSFKITPRWWRV